MRWLWSHSLSVWDTLSLESILGLGWEYGIGARVSCKLNYIDYDSETAIIIKSFDIDDIHLYYEQQVNGGRLIYCSECGKLVLSKSKTCTDKYCPKCKKDKMLENQKRYDNKKRGLWTSFLLFYKNNLIKFFCCKT